MSRPTYEFNDSHFHLTNYIQEGTDIHDFVGMMGTTIGRSTLFGIPLQQQWSYANTGDFCTNLLPADRRAALLLLVYRRVDCHGLQVALARATIAPGSDDQRFQPRRHVCGRSYPPRATDFSRCLSGIGEFTIHKEFVSAKVSGETASLTNPALDKILEFAGEVGLVVIIHNDVDMPFPPGQAQEPFAVLQMKECIRGIPTQPSSGRTWE
jgi:hypothetical protein